MNEHIHKKVVAMNMAKTLADLNQHFIENDNMDKKDFMRIQAEAWQKTKTALKIEVGEDDMSQMQG